VGRQSVQSCGALECGLWTASEISLLEARFTRLAVEGRECAQSTAWAVGAMDPRIASESESEARPGQMSYFWPLRLTK
jgi:hypothetical protein